MLANILLPICAYLLGSISGALLACRWMGLPDPRNHGSGNPGATNVLRESGRKAAVITLIIDIFKGIAAVFIAKWFTISPLILAGTSFMVFLGHLYPVFFEFRGGKGVATALGILMVLNWQVGLAALATWLVILVIFRYVSLASIAAAIVTPAYMFWFTGIPEYILVSFMMSSLLIWRHRSNINNLLTNQEDKINEA
ncbi:MAG: glycerol-3-phosphate 1-O-acyltransferase PlsY [Thioploca sp.]|nr:glycerol-3-phosphate 1-O-acyltransferase PlsY [Thioploca sp.]